MNQAFQYFAKNIDYFLADTYFANYTHSSCRYFEKKEYIV